ncbi:MAG: glycosyltransferase family 2 protein [Nanoarchaeota archaeon]|nr:glycosyltransferase family 2 protein [Nanoarchaeota archaeon]
MREKPIISIVNPIYNEAENIPRFFRALAQVLSGLEEKYEWEIIFIDDGSGDSSAEELRKLNDGRIQVLEFSRNFGKEAALSAGLNQARGEAALMIDADFQHPLELIPEFIAKWEAGAEVVIGIRKKNKKAGLIKNAGSFIFYRIIRRISTVDIIPNETDFRLIGRGVIDAFNRLGESKRMTRALIDWLGFRRDYLYFEAPERTNGRAGYSFSKLVRLAFNSFVSLSLLPLRLAGDLGIFIILTIGPFGLYVMLGKYVFDWTYAASFSGPAQLALLITFLVGIVLCSLGLVALYIAHIHDEVLARPLYIIRRESNKMNTHDQI